MSTISTGTTLTTGYVVTSDTSGALVVQTGSTPTTALTIDANQNTIFNTTGAVTLPTGTTDQRPATPVNGMTRINTTTSAVEVYLTNNSTWNTLSVWVFGSAFNGTNQYLTAPSNAAFAFGTGDFTIECWFNTTTLGASQKLITFYPTGSLTGYNAMYINTANKVLYGANGADQITSTQSINAGVWYHIAAVRQSGTTKLYLNGVQVGSSYTDSTSYLTTRPAIATDGYSLNSNNLSGYLSNVRIVKALHFTLQTLTYLWPH